MTEKPNTAITDNVVKLVQAVDTELSGRHGNTRSSADPVASLLMGNPKFSTPANDEADLPQMAPQGQEGRQARLVRMWVEILAEGEAASS